MSEQNVGQQIMQIVISLSNASHYHLTSPRDHLVSSNLAHAVNKITEFASSNGLALKEVDPDKVEYTNMDVSNFQDRALNIIHHLTPVRAAMHHDAYTLVAAELSLVLHLIEHMATDFSIDLSKYTFKTQVCDQ